eukprot:g11422.t1
MALASASLARLSTRHHVAPLLRRHLSAFRVTRALHAPRDAYSVMGLDRLATPQEVKERFRMLAKQYHPDLNTDAELLKQCCEKVISLRLKQVCPDCRGSGAREGTTWSRCRVCKGSGVHRQEKGILSMGVPCQRCRGSGMVLDHPCRGCRGESTKMMPREIRVSIPPGVRNLMELRIPGAGHAGSRGGKAGHLFVQVKVLPHERFRLVDDDVHLDVPLTLRQALLGTEVMIPTLEGRRSDGEERLKVQAPAQPGTTKVLRGKGVPRCDAGGRGNMVLHFLLQLPRSLSDGRTLRSYTEAVDRTKGSSVQVRGYWGDIINSPYHAFCTRTDPEVRHRLFKINSQQYRHTETDIAEYNLTASGKLPKVEEGQVVETMEAFLLAKASHPVSISAPVTVPGDRVSLKGQRPSTRSWTPLVPALGGVALIAGSRPIRAARAPQVQRLMAQRPIFDPLNLLTDNEGAMKRATSLELVFGRAAMLAAVGVPSAELWHDEIAATRRRMRPDMGEGPPPASADR